MKHFPSRTRPLGPHVLSGELFFQMPGGAAISCSCIAEPYASIIETMWSREAHQRGMDFDTFRNRLMEAITAAGGPAPWAMANQLNERYVADVLRRKREPGETICAAIGMRRRVIYVPIETGEQTP